VHRPDIANGQPDAFFRLGRFAAKRLCLVFFGLFGKVRIVQLGGIVIHIPRGFVIN